MKTTSTLFQRCCSFMLILYVCASVCSQAKAQIIPSSVATEWQIGNQTIVFSEGIKNAVELRIAEYDTAHIRTNIEPIMLTLEWVRTFAQSTTDSVPAEFCYLALFDNHLIKPQHNKSQITRKADNAFWGLSRMRVERLRLQNSLHQNEYIDNSRNLYLTTSEMFKVFKYAQDYFQNWTLTLAVLDFGYEEGKLYVDKKCKRSAYKGNEKFVLDMHNNVLIEYFALRHVLEHLIVKQPTPKRNLVFHFPEKPISLDKAHRLYETDKADLLLYNPWIKGTKIPKDAEVCWFALHDRGHSYPFPSLPKKKAVAEKINPKENQNLPATPQKPSEKIQPKQDVGASPKEDEKFLVPDAENITDEVPHLHKARKGESLFSIAKTYQISLEQMRELNPAKRHTNLVRVGDVLIIRAKDIREQMDRKGDKPVLQSGTSLMRGSSLATFQRRFKHNRVQRRVEQAQTPQMRGKVSHNLPRFSPTQSKGKRPYQK